MMKKSVPARYEGVCESESERVDNTEEIGNEEEVSKEEVSKEEEEEEEEKER